MRGKAPTLEVDLTDYGYQYAGIRPLDEASVHVRTYHLILPFHQIRPSRSERGGRSWPATCGCRWMTSNTMVYNWEYSTTDEPLTDEDRLERRLGNGPRDVDQTTFRSRRNRENNYLLDRQVQKTESFTGIDGINTQDRAIQESMGAIVDRSREHLGPGRPRGDPGAAAAAGGGADDGGAAARRAAWRRRTTRSRPARPCCRATPTGASSPRTTPRA